jgi:asparagine synthase (glutamine-hydrolysing)
VFSDLVPSQDLDSFYRTHVSQWRRPIVLGDGVEANGAFSTEAHADRSDIERMSITDALAYLPDDILVKVDRAAMAVSLETRVPLLDQRIVEFAWRVPIGLKIHSDSGKWVLRQILHKHVPREMVERPKKGFGVPVGLWYQGALRDWAEDLLSENRLRADGVFDASQIRERWAQHLGGRHNWKDNLWVILMFQAWYSAGVQHSSSSRDEASVRS